MCQRGQQTAAGGTAVAGAIAASAIAAKAVAAVIAVLCCVRGPAGGQAAIAAGANGQRQLAAAAAAALAQAAARSCERQFQLYCQALQVQSTAGNQLKPSQIGRIPHSVTNWQRSTMWQC